MATVSTRLDDSLKAQAEEIADQIGIPLSTAICVFLKKFVSHAGFPFDVTVSHNEKQNIPAIELAKLEEIVKKAVSDPSNTGRPTQFTYLDPKTNQLTIVERKE